MVRLLAAFMVAACMLVPAQASAAPPGASAAHRSGICGEIKKLDLLLYEDRNHGPTTTCSFTDARLLIKPNAALTPERSARFAFLAFTTVGFLFNDDYALPLYVYVGFGADCQVMASSDAARLQREAKYGGKSGMSNAYQMSTSAKKVACPK